MAVKRNDEALPGVDVLRYVPQFSYAFMNVALFAGGLTAAATSALILRTGAFRRWLGWLGAPAAVVLIIGPIALGALLIPVMLIWTLATSFEMWRGPAAMPGHSASPASP